MKKKVTALSNKKGCEDVRPWIRSISNHLYWCALSSKGDAALVVAKWTSLAAHVQNLHDHDNDLYPTCSHPPVDNTAYRKKWLKPSMLFLLNFILFVFKCFDSCGHVVAVRMEVYPYSLTPSAFTIFTINCFCFLGFFFK